MPSLVSQTSPSAQNVAQILKQTTAHLKGRERSPDRRRKPWRNSYDAKDARAQVRVCRPGQTPASALGLIDDHVTLAREASREKREIGKPAPLPSSYLAIYRATLAAGLDFSTGLCAISRKQIAAIVDVSTKTVERAHKRLKQFQMLFWVRRTAEVAVEGEWLSIREQIENAYFIDLSRLSDTLKDKWRGLRAWRERRQREKRLAREALEQNAAEAQRRRSELAELAAATPASEDVLALRASLTRMSANIERREAGKADGQRA